jgi:predicted metal-dependent hydrolase
MRKKSLNSVHLHPNAIKGIHLFNQKKFFDAHEELEFAWRAEEGQIRDLYRGILQIGVAYYHIERRNFSGAKKILLRSTKWLKPFSGRYLGINIDKLKKDAANIYKKIEDGFFDNSSQIDNEVFNTIDSDF